MSYFVRKFRLKNQKVLQDLRFESGTLYSNTVRFFWRTVRKKDIWLKPSSLMRLYNSDKLHAHSADASVQAFFHSLQSWRTLRKTCPEAKPPRKLHKFFQVIWKNSAIRFKNNDLILSNGRGNQPLVFKNWKHVLPVQCTLHWNGSFHELICLYSVEPPPMPEEHKILAVDLGQIHAMACSDGTIFNGRLLRSFQQWRHKKTSDFQTRMDTKKKGSRAWKNIRTHKQKFLKKADNRIRDILHKYTSRLVSMCKAKGTDTLVVGDLKGYRQDNNNGSLRNQENHDWLYSKLTWMLQYKTEKNGLNFRLQEESYTSRTCPVCGHIHKTSPKGRWFRCRVCGFESHRDVVGAINILQKYLGAIPVVGAMRPPWGIRYNPYLPVACGASCFQEPAGL